MIDILVHILEGFGYKGFFPEMAQDLLDRFSLQDGNSEFDRNIGRDKNDHLCAKMCRDIRSEWCHGRGVYSFHFHLDLKYGRISGLDMRTKARKRVAFYNCE